MAEGGEANEHVAYTSGFDSKGNPVRIVAVVDNKGKLRTAMVRATGNSEQDDETALRASRPTKVGPSPLDEH